MNLLKKFFVLLMAAVFCLSLTACGGSDDAAVSYTHLTLPTSLEV